MIMTIRMPAFKVLSLTTVLALTNTVSYADILPGPAMPDVVGKSLKAQQPTAQVAQPTEAFPQEQEKTAGNTEQAKKIKFKLTGITIVGNKVISIRELAPLYQKQMGKTITVADLFVIVQEITNYYRNKGYIISRAVLPPQHVTTGSVKIQIIEGYLDQVQITGNSRGAKCLVRAFGKDIVKSKPLVITDMETYLNLANEIPATTVKAVLAPSKASVGAADLVLNVDNKPITGYLSYDNYGTRYIGPQQMTANLAFNSLLTSGDSLQATMSKTPKGGELTFTDVNYNMAVFREYTRLLIGSTRTHTHPLFVLRPSQIDGLNNNYYGTITYPVLRERTQSWNLTFGFNYLDTQTTSLDTQLYADHIRSIDFGTLYAFADRFYGSNTMIANFRQGLPIWGYSRDTVQTTAETSRPGGHAQYTKFATQLSRVQAIRGPWSLYGVVKGQWSWNPLLSSEQFTFGGNPLGRGYDPAEIIGDRGLAGSLELRYDLGINKFFLSILQLYTFYDAGAIWNMLTSSGTPGKMSGTSTGVGTRFYMTKYISGNFMWTQTLTKPVAAEQIIHQGRRPRLFFSVVAAF